MLPETVNIVVKNRNLIHRAVDIIFIAVIFFSGYKIYDIIGISQNSKIQDSISEKDCFRNPQMADDTLYEIKLFSEEKGLDFVKITAALLNANEFDLRKTDINSIDVKRYNKIYQKMQKDKDFEEYMNSVKAILSDVSCFPVAIDKNNKYKYSFEDSFGSARSYNGNYSHEGTDIMASVDESGIYPIVSVSDGVVENAGWLPKGGYRIGIRGKHGGYFYYAHLHKGSVTVNKGDKVKAGQVIGYMGDTGYGEEGTTGKFPVHLHFGMYIRTKKHAELSVNPYFILRYLENYQVCGKYK